MKYIINPIPISITNIFTSMINASKDINAITPIEM